MSCAQSYEMSAPREVRHETESGLKQISSRSFHLYDPRRWLVQPTGHPTLCAQLRLASSGERDLKKTRNSHLSFDGFFMKLFSNDEVFQVMCTHRDRYKLDHPPPRPNEHKPNSEVWRKSLSFGMKLKIKLKWNLRSCFVCLFNSLPDNGSCCFRQLMRVPILKCKRHKIERELWSSFSLRKCGYNIIQGGICSSFRIPMLT